MCQGLLSQYRQVPTRLALPPTNILFHHQQSNMAENDLSAAPPPCLTNFDAIDTYATTITPELSYFRNLPAIQGDQHIRDLLNDPRGRLKKDIKDAKDELKADSANVKARLARTENSAIRLRNTQAHAGDPAATLLPLLDLRTGFEILNHQTTIAQINELIEPQATHILQGRENTWAIR